MGVIYMSNKSAMILLVVLSLICLPDGIHKGDIKETIVGAVCLLYAVISLINIRRKKLTNPNDGKASSV